MIHLLSNGEIYITDKNGKGTTLQNTLMQPSSSENKIREIDRIGDSLYITGSSVAMGAASPLDVLYVMNLQNGHIENKGIDPTGFTNARDISPRGIVVSCYSNRWIEKSDLDENAIWFIDFPDVNMRVNDLLAHSNGNIYMIGGEQYDPLDEFKDGVLLALDSNGAVLWHKTFPPSEMIASLRTFRDFNRIIESEDGLLIIGGSDGYAPAGPVSAALIMKIDLNSEVIWENLSRLSGEGDEVKDLITNNDGAIVAAGISGMSDFYGPERAFILKIKDFTVSTAHPDGQKTGDIMIYPNPAGNHIFMDVDQFTGDYFIEILYAGGKTLIQDSNVGEINISRLSPGPYWVKVINKDDVFLASFHKL